MFILGLINYIDDELYPIGIIIHSTTLNTATKVKAIYHGTTWISHSGYVLRGATSGVTANSATKTGGEDTHTLTINEIPSHTHTYTHTRVITGTWWGAIGNSLADNQASQNSGAAGGGQAHNNIPNYKSVYIWERTA